jgi:hypothetical protein
MAKIAELEKQLSLARKELETLRVRLGAWAWLGSVGLLKTGQLGLLLDIFLHPGKKLEVLCARELAGRHLTLPWGL